VRARERSCVKPKAVNPNTIVVLQSGQPIAMPWLSNVKAVLEAWYAGDQAGAAAADILLGKDGPAGRLPMTWPVSVDQEVAHQSSRPERSDNGVHPDGSLCGPAGFAPDPTCLTTYSEGLNIGYRFFDATHETPLCSFGYGLSYTTFHYSGLQTSSAADGGERQLPRDQHGTGGRRRGSAGVPPSAPDDPHRRAVRLQGTGRLHPGHACAQPDPHGDASRPASAASILV
jgi:hypothetical protein